MTKHRDLAIPAIGSEFRLRPRPMTRERMRWYVDAQPTVAADDGRVHTQEPTIHDDDDYARSQGLPGIIADGMVSTNWLLGLLIDVFGESVLERLKFSTKYVSPVHEDQIVIPCARVTRTVEEVSQGLRIELDVWCEDDNRKVLTAGKATIFAPASVD
ncbi:MAG: MaoC family dehydratase [Pseudomonadota bacterium]|nr:MaoC family dehydratase [Pseudomonadota bacterium]